MTAHLQLFMILGAIVLLLIIFALLKRGLMSVKYSLLWLALAVGLVIAAAFPYVVYVLRDLLDIEMPGVNGLEAAEQIREEDRDCSIIFLTAFDEFSYAKRAISVHALDYLLKPGTEEELVAVLEEAVRIAEEQETDREAGEKKSAEQISAERDCHEDTADTERSRIRLQAVAGNIQAFIEHNYMDDISLQTVAEAMNYSDAYFCKIFKQCFDKNFIVYLSEYRVARAKELLGDVLINVKDVSQKVGYRDSNYFAKVFKRIAGVTPTEYRMQVLKEAGER